jgi:hypothetical protein
VKSLVTEDYIACFRRLPDDVKSLARKNYKLWLANPGHPGLQFKRIGNREPVYSVRVGIGWRALGLLEGDTATWFWIGSHAEYDKLITSM